MNKPNLIYILADDMGYGDVSCLNPQCGFRTPNFDRLAREGIRFTDAHASSAVCTPSRYSILTGRYNWRSAMKHGVLVGYSSPMIEPDRKTVGALFQENGYKTACIGKWHLGMDWTLEDGSTLENYMEFLKNPPVDYTVPVKNGPVTKGFDYYYGIAASLDMPPYVYIENDHAEMLPDHTYAGTLNETVGGYKPRLARPGPCAPNFEMEDVLPHLTRKALDKISEYKDSPFFLYLPLTAPHTPILPSSEFLGKSGTNIYGDFCLMVDDVVGQILDRLKLEGIDENTIVIFASDNGCSPHADYETLSTFGHNPSYHFRGHKADIYEGGHRIPLLVRWPAGIAPGQCSDETVCLSDLMATAADILGVTLPDNMGEDSVSNLPLWQGRQLDHSLREATVHQSDNGSLSIRRGRYKLEMCPGSGGWSYPVPGSKDEEGLPSLQLYDLEADVGETRNLCEERPEIVRQMADLLADYVLRGRSTPGAPQDNTGAPIWETVRWLENYL